MINREATIRWKGYDPDDLSINSNKRVWDNCKGCGHGRWVSKQQSGKLCTTCSNTGENNSMFGKFHSDKAKKLMSENSPDQSGINNPMFGRDRSGINNPMFNKNHTEETKKLMCDNHADVSGENNPMFGVSRRGELHPSASRPGKSNPNYGHTWSEEKRGRMSAKKQGIPYEEWEGFTTTDWRDWNKAIYVNEPFIGCHRHHITETIVACIPAELHDHVRHNLKTGSNMGEMNVLAIQFINGGLEV